MRAAARKEGKMADSIGKPPGRSTRFYAAVSIAAALATVGQEYTVIDTSPGHLEFVHL
jgi:hypothetical protein